MSAPLPYYADEYVTLYHAKCEAVLPSIAQRVAVVTDQPYGTGWGAPDEMSAR